MAANCEPANDDPRPVTDTEQEGQAIPAHTSRRHLLTLLGVGGLGSVVGCSSDPTGGGDGRDTDKPSDPKTTSEAKELLDHATIGVDYPVASQVDYSILSFYTRSLEPLVWTTPSLEVKPWLVTDWQRTGKLTWEFTLRDDVTYHNGDPLTADRVLSVMDWALSRQLLGGALATPQTANTTQEGISKVDEKTIEIETIEPTVSQPANIAIFTYFGAHPASSGHTEDPSTRGDFSNIIGTGPYQIDSVQKGQHVQLSAFEDYWGEPPHTNDLTIRQFDDQNTLALALKANEVDVGLELPANQYEPIKQAQDTEVATRTAPKTAKLWFNLESGPFSNKTLRKAVNYAISQEEVVKGSQNGLATPARGPIPPIIQVSAHDDLPKYGPERDKAKQLVEESGYTDEAVTILTTTTEPRAAKLVTQIIQQNLNRIGLTLDVQVLGITSWTQRRDNGDGHLFLGEETMNAPDEPFQEAMGRYGSRGKDAPWLEPEPTVQKRLDTLFKKIRTNTGATRQSAMREAQHLIMDEALEAPLYHESYIVGMHSGITGVDWHPLSNWSRLETLQYLK